LAPEHLDGAARAPRQKQNLSRAYCAKLCSADTHGSMRSAYLFATVSVVFLVAMRPLLLA
jgi:hypothetical protein